MTYLLNSGIAVSLNNSPTTATYSSGGAALSTTVVISAANSSILVGQTMSGTGIAVGTTVTNVSGTTITFSPAATGQISGTITFSTKWYELTDHNRSEISITPILIEKEARMANGTLRKFVVSKKDIISTSWSFLPSSHIATKYSLASGTVVGGNIVYVVNGSHNLVVGSVVRISGLPSEKFNYSSATVTAIFNNTFTIVNTSGATGNTTGTGSAQDLNKLSITTVDANYGGGWIKSFYNANNSLPVYVKITSSKYTDPSLGQIPSDTTFVSGLTGETIYQTFMTGFSYNTVKRTRSLDYVDITLEFTEI